jgi:hypothetical protein
MRNLILVYLVRKYANRANISIFKYIHTNDIKRAIKTAEIEYKAGRENEFFQQVVKSCLKQYFENEYLVKDDQMIILDCIIHNEHKFALGWNGFPKHSPGRWFFFRDYLNPT